MIRWYVNKLHVSVSDAELAEDIGTRAINAGWGPLSVIGAIAHALAIHHDNQRTYRWVVNGLHGRP